MAHDEYYYEDYPEFDSEWDSDDYDIEEYEEDLYVEESEDEDEDLFNR